MSYSYNVPYGDGEITVHANDIEDLHFKVSYVKKLAEAAEIGRTTDAAWPDAYRTTGGDKYVGFRRPDNAFVAFAKSKTPDDERFPFFAYAEGYVNENKPQIRYKGYQLLEDGEIRAAPPLINRSRDIQKAERSSPPENSGILENSEPTHPGTITEDEANKLRDLAEANRYTSAGIKNYLNGMGVETLADLPRLSLEDAQKEFSLALKAPFYNLTLSDADLATKPAKEQFSKFHTLGTRLAEAMGREWDGMRQWMSLFTAGKESSRDLCQLHIFALNEAMKIELEKRGIDPRPTV